MREAKPRERENLPLKTRVIVLTETGYRCAVPTCRNILALDMHHIWEVSAGGTDDSSNLIALCPTCHALYHRGTIKAESIYVYKSMIVAITRAFDVEAIDRLLFLNSCKKDFLVVSGDGLLHFARLIAAGFAVAEQKSNNNWQLVTYAVNINAKGQQLVEAWQQGDRVRLRQVMGGVVPGGATVGRRTTKKPAATRVKRPS
ncbi:HNH endonuclease [Rhodopseudomonas palustris BisB18]|uniref:HNH endonuclease n=1 Tax=Rhodopseudomonas palustris (strain BisB18) TaxID=316056 RepID=Q21AN9_RHOPB